MIVSREIFQKIKKYQGLYLCTIISLETKDNKVFNVIYSHSIFYKIFTDMFGNDIFVIY